jgi:polyhydroxyalkanoate synthesis regulator phasin
VTNENRNIPSSPNELVEAWVQSAAEAERRWNEYFGQMMNTDSFAQAMTRSAEGFAAMQAMFARGMQEYLRGLNIPTQGELARLAERVTALERRLDSLGEQLDPTEQDGTRPGSRKAKRAAPAERS